MPLEGRWFVFVCSGCGECTGRHKACEALRVRTPVVPVDDAAVERVARALCAVDGADPDDCSFMRIHREDALVVLRAAGEQP